MFGHHLHSAGREPIADRISASVATVAADYDFKQSAAQVFFTGPRGATPVLKPADEPALKTYLAETGLVLLVHGAYIDVYWSERADVARRAVANIRRELAMCARVGARGLVVHLPQDTVSRATTGLSAIFAAPMRGAILYLENPGNGHPSKGDDPRGFETPAKLARLLTAVRAELSPEAYEHIGLCVDTAHLWSSGVDLRSRGAARAWLREFEEVRAAAKLPPSRLMFHFNDSRTPLDSGNDQHAPFGEGQIWGSDAGEDLEGYTEFVAYAVQHEIPAVFERSPKYTLDADYLALIGALGH